MLSMLLACTPFRPAAEPPPLAVAAAPVVRLADDPEHPGGVWLVRAGSAFDPPGREGLAFVAAAVVAGRLGAGFAVERERVTFDLRGAAADVGALLRLPVTREEVGMAVQTASVAGATTCAARAVEAWMTWQYAGHPYGHPTTGRVSVIPTLTAAEVQNFLAAWYVRDAMVVVGPEARGLDRISGALVRAPVPTVLPAATRARALVSHEPSGECVAFGAVGVGPRDAAERRALARMATALGAEVPTEPLVDPGWVLVRPGRLDDARLAVDTLAAGGLAEAAFSAVVPPGEADDGVVARATERLLGRTAGAEGDLDLAETHAAIARWLGPDTLRFAALTPAAGEYGADTVVLPYEVLVR